MGTVVYPDPEVDSYLAANFVGLKISLLEKHPDFKEAIGGQPVPWAPTMRFTDGKGREVRRSVGWLDRQDFLAELKMAQGQHHLTRWRVDEALETFEAIETEHASARAAPEAGYYAGVALFMKGKRDMAALKSRWNRLREQHPNSDWAYKASVVDDLPADL